MIRILTETIILQMALKLQGFLDLYGRGREGDSQQIKRVQTWAGSDVFNEIFRILNHMNPLYKLRYVSWYFFSN